MAIDDRDIVLASTPLADGQLRLELSVPSIHCGGCIHKIETALSEIKNVASARVNLSTKRLTVCFWNKDKPPAIGTTLSQLGFEAHLSGSTQVKSDAPLRSLLKALAVAAFAAMNIMMLSVAVWAGADPQTRQMFHLVSAIIAFPALIYSGRVFYLSAWQAVKHGRTNMDVPISVGLFITFAMSLYDTVIGGEHAYFDAATMLLFFLLIGRTLDHMMRERARSAVNGLQKLIPIGVNKLEADGTTTYLPTDKIEPGMMIALVAGNHVPVDGIIEKGYSDIDLSLVSGESDPVTVQKGSSLVSGALNLSGPLVLRVTAPANGSYLADMIRLMERAEQSRSQFSRLADRVASLYAPFVHLTAIIAFAFWFILNGDAHHALTIAVSVLIITCPCALALAVPMVQVTASRRLFEAGILIKDGSALERLNEVGSIIFDKTGTLTLDEPALLNPSHIEREVMQVAASLAVLSSHPYARSIDMCWKEYSSEYLEVKDVAEIAGCGIEGIVNSHTYRLGRIDWAATDVSKEQVEQATGPILTKDGVLVIEFKFKDELRPESKSVIQELQRYGIPLSILSGDTKEKVVQIASSLDLEDYCWAMVPDQKLNVVETASRNGEKPLMIGDGINDAPALAAAHVSIAPASATDVGRTAADIVLLRNNLDGILTLFGTAKMAKRLTTQNIGFAIAYNLVAIPFAFLGYITPLYAALAMSASSVIVVVNALRLSNASLTKIDSRSL